jgi:hypothetical protein
MKEVGQFIDSQKSGAVGINTESLKVPFGLGTGSGCRLEGGGVNRRIIIITLKLKFLLYSKTRTQWNETTLRVGCSGIEDPVSKCPALQIKLTPQISVEVQI